MSSAVEGAFWMSAAPRFQTGRGAYPISPRVRTIPAYRRVRTIPVAPGVVRTLEFMDRRGNPNLEFMDRRGNPNPTGPWLIHMCPRSGPRVIRALSSNVARGCLLLRLTADHWTTRVVQMVHPARGVVLQVVEVGAIEAAANPRAAADL